MFGLGLGVGIGDVVEAGGEGCVFLLRHLVGAGILALVYCVEEVGWI